MMGVGAGSVGAETDEVEGVVDDEVGGADDGVGADIIAKTDSLWGSDNVVI